MKRTLSFALAVLATVPMALHAAGNAVPPIGDPQYSGFPMGGFEAGGSADVKHRCADSIKSQSAKLAYPAAAGDLGRAPCKHHVWKLLRTEADWNSSRFMAEAPWKAAAAAAQGRKLEEIDDAFYRLDKAYLGVLTAAKEAVAAAAPSDGKCSGQSALWDGEKPGPKATEYYKKLHAFQRTADAVAANAAGVAAEAPAVVGVDARLSPIVQAVDEVLAAHLASTHDAVEKARAACRTGGSAGSVTAAASAKLGTDLGKWNEAITKGEARAALDKHFTGAAERADGVPDPAGQNLKTMLRETRTITNKDGVPFLSQRIRVPDPKGGAPLDTFVYTELQPDDTVDTAAQRLANKIRSSGSIMSRVQAVGEATRDAAANPARTAGEVVNGVKTEGPWAFMAGQTRPDMERKIEGEKADTMARASSEFADDKRGLQGQFESAVAQCRKLWADSEAQEAAEANLISRTLAGERAKQATERLQKKLSEARTGFTVFGPAEAQRDANHLQVMREVPDPDRPGKTKKVPVMAERKPVKCDKDMERLTTAYTGAMRRSQDALADAGQVAEQKAGIEADRVVTKENVRKQSRRRYFRNGFKDVLKRKALEGMVTAEAIYGRGLLDRKQYRFEPDQQTKADVVLTYLETSWADAGKKFYLDDWKPEENPPTPKPEEYSAWEAVETGRREDGRPAESADKRQIERENRFLENMQDLYPFYKSSVLHRAPPQEDKVVFGEVEKWVKADFEEYLKEKYSPSANPAQKGQDYADLVELADRARQREKQAKAKKDADKPASGGQP